MTSAPAIVEMRGVVKDHGGAEPLRVEALVLSADTALVIQGLDHAAAETFVHLVSGAALPDEGHVIVGGTDTRSIATDREWLASLDRFGVVTERAVLLGGLSVAANVALPMSLSIEPMADALRAAVEELAEAVELPRAMLDVPVSSIDPPTRARVHLARALAGSPALVLLEHPTATFTGPDEGAAFGRSLRRAVEIRRVGWLALSDDRAFARATGARAKTLHASTGRLRSRLRFWPWERS